MKDWKVAVFDSQQRQVKKLYTSLLNNLANHKKREKICSELLELFTWFECRELADELKTTLAQNTANAKLLRRVFAKFFRHADLMLEAHACYVDVNTLDQPAPKFETLTNLENSQKILKTPHHLQVVCENVESAHNVGSILRTSECLAAEQIYTTGTSPQPGNIKVSKTAMGCERYLNWVYAEFADDIITQLNNDGYITVALETVSNPDPVQTIQTAVAESNKFAIIVGNETHGLSQSALKCASFRMALPCHGIKNSLNVANAFSAAAYLLLPQ